MKVVAVLVDVNAVEKYEEAKAKAKCMILDRVKDHVIPHIAEKTIAKEMWDTLTTLYQGSSVQRKMLLENQLRSYQMQKGEEIDPFLLRLQGITNQLTFMGSTPDPEFLVRTTLNAIPEEWETFVQSILHRATLPSWEMWAALQLQELRRLTKAGSSGKGVQIKEDEDDAALASTGQQGLQKRKKKYISKVKCFNCGELGHYASQ